ncbi:hypothetical protein HO173_007141 [Letharia columbiana]|uniref:Uncharacterized protein n=1 Tax=Letharia columbiana TaxID=112416 RepID=A0A8H6FTK6_9LECA|nr:uncharacterized protein HO173_007141 [Letharia columbiana]KAF6234516.1 hypothetical protein HO173_007141 [Letharia columbiana]
MADLQMMVSENKRYGEIHTFTGFDSKHLKRIDFIFVNRDEPKLANSNSKRGSPERWWLVEGYAVLPNRFECGIYNSDHQVVSETPQQFSRRSGVPSASMTIRMHCFEYPVYNFGLHSRGALSCWPKTTLDAQDLE